jgi:ubiquinone/menaquinone biosynthesis C-methylase UbiE
VSHAELYDWDAMREAWSHPPVEGMGYVSADALLIASDDTLRDIVREARRERYGLDGWRNYRNRWVDTLHGDVNGRTVLDFGCGFGLEALALAEAGATVSLADITQTNLDIAARVLELHGQQWESMFVIGRYWPFTATAQRFNIFYCNGVLHHIPWGDGIMQRAAGMLTPGGEARLMVYTDQAWREAVGTDPPADVTRDPGFERFVTHMDGVGRYADYYTPERVEQRFGTWFELARWQPLGPTGAYAAAILYPKEQT